MATPLRHLRAEVLLRLLAQHRGRRQCVEHRGARADQAARGRRRRRPSRCRTASSADMLEEQGIQVARRTVAKYREALKIAPANLRKAHVTWHAARAADACSCPARPASRRCWPTKCSAAARRAPAEAARGGVWVEGDARDGDAAEPGEPPGPARAVAAGRRPLPRRARPLRPGARACAGRDWITPQQTLRVDATAQRSPLQSLNFAALRIKDAVCDVLRDATGERPSVDTRHPDLPLALHLGARRTPRCMSTPRARRCSSAAGARTRARRR